MRRCRRRRAGAARRRAGAIAAVVVLLGARAAPADRPAPRLSVAGVLGNSGEAGPTLIRVSPTRMGGAAFDASGTLWLSAGAAINRVTLEGRLVERFPIELKPGEHVWTTAFTAIDDTLFFVCADDRANEQLFALPMRSGATAARVALALPPSRTGRLRIAPDPLHGRLVLAVEERGHPAETTIFFYAPGTRTLTRAFTVASPETYGLAVDANRRWIYVAGPRETVAVDPAGHPVSDAFPARPPDTSTTPTVISSIVHVADGALWESGTRGFLVRADSMMRLAPGMVERFRFELGFVTDVRGLGPGLVAMASDQPSDAFLARWDDAAGKLTFFRRIGALPAVGGVGISDDGWVTVGDDVGWDNAAQHWWRWDDDARAMPAFTDQRLAKVTGFFMPGTNTYVAVGRKDELAALHPKLEYQPGDLPAFPKSMRPVALAYQADPRQPAGRMFAVDAAARALVSVSYNGAAMRATGDKWTPVPITGVTLESPTEIAALADGRLLVADGARILVLEPAGGGYRAAKMFRGWGRQADAQLGAHLRFAVDGRSLLVSDTDRHRVVWLDWLAWKKVAQLGVTDRAGDDLTHLDHPTSIAVRGARAAVADGGNQRVVKLVLETGARER